MGNTVLQLHQISSFATIIIINMKSIVSTLIITSLIRINGVDFCFKVVALSLLVAVAQAGVYTHSIVEPLVKSAALQGPSSRSTIVGPDGSVIDAVAPGGRIETTVDAGLAAYTAPAHLYAHAAPASFVAARSAVVATPHAVVSHTVPSAYYASPSAAIVAHGAPAVVSARFATVNGFVPSVKTLVASPLTASGYPLFAPGSGLEGQYIPDNLEQLYDDGSYKGEIYP